MFLFEDRIDVPDMYFEAGFKRFKGSNGILKKVQNKYNIFYINIYYNITIIEYFMTPFEFGF